MTQFYGTLTPEKTEREEKNMQLVRKGAGECMVLLENDGALPLKNTGKIALRSRSKTYHQGRYRFR